jgi:hypothetical protein
MTERLDEFLDLAKNARERSACAQGEFKAQWLRVAEMWELLAVEYRRVRGLAAGE